MSSLSSSTVTTTYNPKNLWEDLIPNVTQYWDKSLTTEIKGNLVLATNLLLVCFGLYVVYLLTTRYLALRKPRHLLRVTLATKTTSKLDFELLTLLSRLHTLSKSSVVTFELHKSNKFGGGFTGFIFSSTDLSVLEVIRQTLVTTDGVNSEIVAEQQDLDVEPLMTQFRAYQDKLSPRPYQLQLLASSQFGNFRLDQNQLVQNLVASLLSLEQVDYGSVVIAFRPVIKEHAIKSRIASLNFKFTKEADKYGVNQNMLAEVKELQLKNQYPLFQVRIVVLGSSRQIVNNLASSFNLLSQDNRLTERLSNFSLPALRFVPRENLFTIFNRSAFGSLLNTRELSSLVQLASFGDGGELRNKEGIKEIKKVSINKTLNLKTNSNSEDSLEVNHDDSATQTESTKVAKPRLKAKKQNKEIEIGDGNGNDSKPVISEVNVQKIKTKF